VERLRAPVFVPPPYEFNDDVEWLRDDLERLEKEGQVFSAGDRLPVGVEAFPGMEPNDLMLWVESRRALVVGDTLIDRGNGLEIPWPPPGGVRCNRCWSCRSSSCSRRTGRPPTEPPSTLLTGARLGQVGLVALS
jgi:glyoxylase-like metal-dependent hydrolase (beta-lactamase superfamily II)